MSIRNETLRKKLEHKRDSLLSKIQPWQDELDLTNRMLVEMDAYDAKAAQAAQAQLGLTETPEGEE